MPADPDSTSWMAGMLAAIGIGGGGSLLGMFAKQSNHAARINQLEEDRRLHGIKIDKTHTTVTELKGITERTEKDVTSILSLLRERDE